MAPPYPLLLLALAAGLAHPAQAGESDSGPTATLSLIPEWQWEKHNSPSAAALPNLARQNRGLRQELAVRAQQGGANLQATWRQQASSGQSPEQHGIVNQLYYDGELGGSSAGSAYTVGKKVLSWGVGFGFRPLDVVQREDRRSLHPPALVGIPLLAWEQLDRDDALTLVWQRPGSGQGQQASADPALAAHWYRLDGALDMHAVARLSARNGLEAGAGFSRTLGEAWVMYGACLQEQRYDRPDKALAEGGSDPLHRASGRQATKGVAGVQWAGSDGLGILLEAWYDGEAPSRQVWQQLDRQFKRLPTSNGDAANNSASTAQLFNSPNLRRQNLLLRLSYEQEQRWQAAVDLLYTPEDGGRAIGLNASYQGNRQRISGGLRLLGGPANAALMRSPLAGALWLEWRYALF